MTKVCFLVLTFRGNETDCIPNTFFQHLLIFFDCQDIISANTFIIDPDKLVESIAENKEIIERLTKMPSNERKALGILIHGDIFMLTNYRKVFVHGEEIVLAKSNFEILKLLLSHTGRVFTHEQIYLHAYGSEASPDTARNAVRCHIKRLRKRLNMDTEQEAYIDSVRSIGYRIAV